MNKKFTTFLASAMLVSAFSVGTVGRMSELQLLRKLQWLRKKLRILMRR